MSWLILPGYLVKILFLDTHANILQVRKNFNFFMVSAMFRFLKIYQDVICFLSGCIGFRDCIKTVSVILSEPEMQVQTTKL